VAAGKSTVARLVAQKLGYTYVDSGAMYRALAWAASQRGISARDPGQVLALLNEVKIRLVPQTDLCARSRGWGEGENQVFLDDRDITGEIRSPEIGQLASQLSEIPEVRQRMVALQQEMAREGGVVMEGRDIQTVVLPDAEVKVFLVAPGEERARRRYLELQQRGYAADFEAVLAEIKARDERDTHRAHSPLRPAPDAVRVNTSGLSIEQVVARVLQIAQARAAP
jgi:cytidylate kinase